ncbi:MAG: hypothetical protein KA370_01285 [Paludibacter sp.]|jgi:hypothetical protein|nr:hypothetical protein [Paludibacter sp.]
MKTSNKLLTGAFIIIVIAMLAGTLAVKNELKQVENQSNEINVEQNDTIQADSTSITIKIN